MSKNYDIHRDMLGRVAERLGNDLCDDFVFVGGCTTCLFVDRTHSNNIRSTHDVDLIVSVLGRGHYEQVKAKLKERGFSDPPPHADEHNHTCALFLDKELQIDLMPIKEEILGFSNSWYQKAFDTANKTVIDSIYGQFEIKLIQPIYFLTTKIEAFQDRGIKDIYGSQDLEDIAILLQGRAGLINEILNHNDTEAYQFIKQNLHDCLTQYPQIESVLQQYSPADVIWNSITRLPDSR